MKKDPLQIVDLVLRRLRALCYFVLTGKKFRLVGSCFRFFGTKYINVGFRACFGHGCWIQAIDAYKGTEYAPEIIFGDNLSCSDNVHISCANRIVLGSGVLIGSNVYIGDHSHGSTRITKQNSLIPPAFRPLDDLAPIVIEDNVWICDGVIILAGSHIATGSIVGANSIVKGSFTESGLIVGSPAKLVRKFI
jgi:acetyltransferase-like isoleucine patch superfamily enzyme